MSSSVLDLTADEEPASKPTVIVAVDPGVVSMGVCVFDVSRCRVCVLEVHNVAAPCRGARVKTEPGLPEPRQPGERRPRRGLDRTRLDAVIGRLLSEATDVARSHGVPLTLKVMVENQYVAGLRMDAAVKEVESTCRQKLGGDERENTSSNRKFEQLMMSKEGRWDRRDCKRTSVQVVQWLMLHHPGFFASQVTTMFGMMSKKDDAADVMLMVLASLPEVQQLGVGVVMEELVQATNRAVRARADVSLAVQKLRNGGGHEQADEYEYEEEDDDQAP